jgi:predicted DNA-binding transcriptional regulator AlpA
MKLGRILTSEQMRDRVGGISRWTEMRMHERNQGPPRIRIDGRSWGYPENLLEEWLLSRLEKPLPANPTTTT